MSEQINRKLRTRKALLDSALEWVSEGRHFASLSIREVAKKAGVSPNAFYRHFKDLDELALALVDELGLMLRQLMRQARLRGLAANSMINDSVDFFIEQVQTNPNLFRFMAQCLTGGSASTREAIRHELNYFSKELVTDLNRLRVLTHIDAEDLDMIGILVVNTVAMTITDLLDTPEGSDNLIRAVRSRTVKQVRLIFIGADSWRSDSDRHKKKDKEKPAAPKPSKRKKKKRLSAKSDDADV